MTLPVALNIFLWALLVLGTGVYLVVRLWERHAMGENGLIASHVILGRLALFLLALGGIGVLGGLLSDADVPVRFVLVVIRSLALAAVWTLVIYDIQRVRRIT